MKPWPWWFTIFMMLRLGFHRLWGRTVNRKSRLTFRPRSGVSQGPGRKQMEDRDRSLSRGWWSTIYNSVGSVRKRQQGMLMCSGLGSAWVNIAMPEGVIPETWRGVRKRMLIPACGFWLRNTATIRLGHVRARAKRRSMSLLFSFPDLPQVSPSGQTQKGARDLGSPLTAVDVGQSCGTREDQDHLAQSGTSFKKWFQILYNL